jgi:pimeloyl-ACP methyl ester carboxylesterase
MKTSTTSRIGDIDVHYTIEGDGQWITLAHSLACDGSMWDEQAALLSQNYRVLRYDARGHGKTTRNWPMTCMGCSSTWASPARTGWASRWAA